MRTLNQYCKETFGEKLYKLSLNGGMTCPNRDGTLGDRGCIFCSAGGSGDFCPCGRPASGGADRPGQSPHRPQISGQPLHRLLPSLHQHLRPSGAPQGPL